MYLHPVPYRHLHMFRCQPSGSAQSRAVDFCAGSPLRTGPADPCCRAGGFTTLLTQIQFQTRLMIHIPLKKIKESSEVIIAYIFEVIRQT